MQKISGKRIAFVLTILICVLMVIFRRGLAVGISLFIMAIWGPMRPCPLNMVYSSYVTTNHQAEREAELSKQARLLERDPDGYELYEIASQRFWMPAGSSSGAIVDLTEEERGIYDYDGSLLKAGDIILDAGANIGLYTRHALMHGASKVVAIEPAPENLECLRRNLRDEIATGKVIIYPKGVWNKEDILEMNLEPDNPMGDSFVSQSSSKTTKMKLSVTTIDKLVEELHLERVDVIKMDIEGSERQALEGAANSIRRFRPRMAISMYHLPDDPDVIPGLISSIRKDYQQGCGTCVLAPADGLIRPQVYFYY
jgi:FkbM family methyltransferase